MRALLALVDFNLDTAKKELPEIWKYGATTSPARALPREVDLINRNAYGARELGENK